MHVLWNDDRRGHKKRDHIPTAIHSMPFQPPCSDPCKNTAFLPPTNSGGTASLDDTYFRVAMNQQEARHVISRRLDWCNYTVSRPPSDLCPAFPFLQFTRTPCGCSSKNLIPPWNMRFRGRGEGGGGVAGVVESAGPAPRRTSYCNHQPEKSFHRTLGICEQRP